MCCLVQSVFDDAIHGKLKKQTHTTKASKSLKLLSKKGTLSGRKLLDCSTQTKSGELRKVRTAVSEAGAECTTLQSLHHDTLHSLHLTHSVPHALPHCFGLMPHTGTSPSFHSPRSALLGWRRHPSTPARRHLARALSLRIILPSDFEKCPRVADQAHAFSKAIHLCECRRHSTNAVVTAPVQARVDGGGRAPHSGAPFSFRWPPRMCTRLIRASVYLLLPSPTHSRSLHCSVSADLRNYTWHV